MITSRRTFDAVMTQLPEGQPTLVTINGQERYFRRQRDTLSVASETGGWAVISRENLPPTPPIPSPVQETSAYGQPASVQQRVPPLPAEYQVAGASAPVAGSSTHPVQPQRGISTLRSSSTSGSVRVARTDILNASEKSAYFDTYFSHTTQQANELFEGGGLSARKQGPMERMAIIYEHIEAILTGYETDNNSPFHILDVTDSRGRLAGVAAVQILQNFHGVSDAPVLLIKYVATNPASLARLTNAPREAGRKIFEAIYAYATSLNVGLVVAEVESGARAAYEQNHGFYHPSGAPSGVYARAI